MNAAATELVEAAVSGLEIVSRRAVETFSNVHSSDAGAEALHHARRCLVDWVGLAIAGVREEPVRIIAEAVAGGGPAGVIGDPGAGVSPFAAALVMGAASHVLDYDDTDHVNLVHVSSTLFPALFARACVDPVSGRGLLAAVVAGYEAEDRIGAFLGRPLTARGWHVTGVLGRFGSALATTLVTGGDAGRACQAMAIAATSASGLIAAFGTMSKALQVGRAAADGVLAAELARRGFTGPVDCLGQPGGFSDAFVGQPIGDWSRFDDEWGRSYAIARNSFKPHASCMITHPAIDAAVAIGDELRREGIGLTDIDRIEARINPLVLKVADIASPATGLQGKFSVRYCIAAALAEGRATPDLFTDRRVGDDLAARLIRRIALDPSPEIGEQAAALAVEAGGRIFRQSIAMAKGNPSNPMSDGELSAKFSALAGPSLGQATGEVLARLWSFEELVDVGTFLRDLATLTKPIGSSR